MWVVEHVEDAAERLTAAADRAGIKTFPAVPTSPWAQVHWPHPDDPERFVELAVAEGVSVMYVKRLTADQLHEDFEVPDHVLSSDLAAVQAVWVSQGVLHWFEVASRWWEETAATAELSAGIEARDEQARIEQMARQVVDDPVFYDHGGHRQAAKRAVVEEAFPDLDPRMVRQVVWQADEIDKQERKPEREAEWARRGWEMLEEGSTKVDAATELGISVNVLSRVLQQNPPEQQ